MVNLRSSNSTLARYRQVRALSRLASKYLDRRRLRLSRAKVRSTNHQAPGRTTKPASLGLKCAARQSLPISSVSVAGQVIVGDVYRYELPPQRRSERR
jgi:hypothetical protein